MPYEQCREDASPVPLFPLTSVSTYESFLPGLAISIVWCRSAINAIGGVLISSVARITLVIEVAQVFIWLIRMIAAPRRPAGDPFTIIPWNGLPVGDRIVETVPF